MLLLVLKIGFWNQLGRSLISENAAEARRSAPHTEEDQITAARYSPPPQQPFIFILY